MSDNLPAVFQQMTLTTVDDKALDELTTGGFLRRIQLVSKGKYVDKGQCKPGEYAIILDSSKAQSLGTTIDCMVYAMRMKALDTSDRENIVQSYDPASETYQRIKADAQVSDSGCQCGPDFLIVERSTGKLYELFCGTKSMAREAKNIWAFAPLTPQQIEQYVADGVLDNPVEPFTPRPFTMGSSYVEKRFSWFAPTINPCNQPFTDDQRPGIDVIQAEVAKFMKVVTDEKEKNAKVAEAKKGGQTKRAR